MISLMVVVVFLLGYILLDGFTAGQEHIGQQEFNKKFPPISDKEFLSLCSPGTNPIVALEVRRVISASLDVEYARVYPSASLINDYGAC